MRDFAVLVGRVLGRAGRHFSQFFCRHDLKYAFEDERIFLRCASCGVETPGWSIKGDPGIKPPRQMFSGAEGPGIYAKK